MKNILFVIVVIISAMYLAAQSATGRAAIEDYLPLSKIEQWVTDSKQQITQRFSQSTSELETQTQELSSSKRHLSGAESVQEREDISIGQEQKIQSLERRLLFLEEHIALLTQKQNGHAVSNSVVSTSPRLKGLQDETKQTGPEQGKNHVSQKTESGGQLDRQRVLQQIADKRHLAAINGLTE